MRMLNFAKRNFKELIRDPLSLVFQIALPIFLLFIFQQFNIPMEINKIEIIIEINIVYIIFILKLNPNKHAVIKNNVSWITIIGINEIIYPKI